MPQTKLRVLFVCLGNICRSPLAEVVVRAAAARRGLDQFHFASAGTGDWHVGGGADPRSAAKAAEHGLNLSRHRAQQITAANWHDWDLFVAMDNNNRANLLAMGVPAERIWMMRQFESDPESANAPDVPDPYYGSGDGFEVVYQMLCANAAPLLDALQERWQSR